MKINCFIPQEEQQQLKETIESLRKSALIGKIYLLSDKEEGGENLDVEVIRIQNIWSTDTICKIAFFSDTEYSLIYTKNARLQMGTFGMERMFQIASDSSAALVYADHYQVINGLKYLYTEMEDDNRKSGEKLFDYVDPKNHAVQVEMEAACTDHLKKIGAYLKPEFKSVRFDEFDFEYEASVKVDTKSIQERKCFLCPGNLPEQQKGIDFMGKYLVLVNPFPIFPKHLTIPSYEHEPQQIKGKITDMLELAYSLLE